MKSFDLSPSPAGKKIPSFIPKGLTWAPKRAPRKTPPAPVDAAAVAKRAYEKWERGDRLHGFDQENWYAAEAELRREKQSAPADEAPSESERFADRAEADQLEALQRN